MDFRILGPLEIADAGRPIELGGARQRSLLAILLLRRGEVVNADRLIEDLYGDAPPATAAKSLHAHVSRLRRALAPEERLVTRAGGYVLEVAPEELDAERCRLLLAAGRRALAAGEAADAFDSLAQAIALWRGPPLADLAYESFAQQEIARLEQLRLECFEERLEADLALGRAAEVTLELEQLVAANPLRERLRGQLMLALYRTGRQAEALGAYQEARRALVEQLGIEPGRALQQLEHDILNQEPALDPVRAPALAPDGEVRAGRRAAGPFAGRGEELAQLEDAVADARAGRGRLVVLTGESGSGKSRLADELASRAKRAGLRVLWGASWPAGGAPPYWPWVQALRTYVRAAEGEQLLAELGPGAFELARLLPELRELEPNATGEREDAGAARFRLFDATASFVRRVASAQPLLVVLDDLHAADAETLLLLEFSSVELADAPVLLLAAYRDDELDPDDPVAAALASAARRASLWIPLRRLPRGD